MEWPIVSPDCQRNWAQLRSKSLSQIWLRFSRWIQIYFNIHDPRSSEPRWTIVPLIELSSRYLAM